MAMRSHALMDFVGSFAALVGKLVGRLSWGERGWGAYLDEDNRRADGEYRVQISENAKFVLLTAAVHVHLFDAHDGELVVF